MRRRRRRRVDLTALPCNFLNESLSHTLNSLALLQRARLRSDRTKHKCTRNHVQRFARGHSTMCPVRRTLVKMKE